MMSYMPEMPLSLFREIPSPVELFEVAVAHPNDLGKELERCNVAVRKFSKLSSAEQKQAQLEFVTIAKRHWHSINPVFDRFSYHGDLESDISRLETISIFKGLAPKLMPGMELRFLERRGNRIVRSSSPAVYYSIATTQIVSAAGDYGKAMDLIKTCYFVITDLNHK